MFYKIFNIDLTIITKKTVHYTKYRFDEAGIIILRAPKIQITFFTTSNASLSSKNNHVSANTCKCTIKNKHTN